MIGPPATWRRKGKAFTLIELLVVIAILTLLLSMLMPCLAKARESARQAYCLANTHAIGTALQMYRLDYRGYAPRGCEQNREWFVLFLRYLPGNGTAKDFRSAKIYRCPSYPQPKQVICYVVNSWRFAGLADKVGDEISQPTLLVRFRQPSETLYLTDNEWGTWRPLITGLNDPDRGRQDVWNPGHLPASKDTSQLTGRRVPRDRHWNGANVMFVDGRASWMNASAIVIDRWREVR